MGVWQLGEIIGLGASGAVYAAHDGEQHAALKTLHPDRQASDKIRQRFEREARVTRDLAHPNIVQILDLNTTPQGDIYLVMERLRGHALDEMLKRHHYKLNIPQAAFVARGLLAALAHAHAAGVIHRDIKPANIFITQRPATIKLLDFGIAHDDSSDQELTQDGAVLGTPAFMPPEQARGRRDMLDERSDLFACGALLYTMLSGQLTHSAQSPQEALLLAATKPCGSLALIAPDLPPDLIAVVDKALSWNPSKRYQSAQAMLNALNAALEAPRATTHQPSQALGQAAALAQNQSMGDTEQDEPTREEATERHEQLVQAFHVFERSLDASRKYGESHQEVEQQVERAFEALMACATAHGSSLHITIKPYSFNAFDESVWEPGAPFDDIPYNLFSAGIRALTFDAGMTAQEFRQISVLLRCDPRRDLPPEDDLGIALWEGNFPHLGLHMVNTFRLSNQEHQAEFIEACLNQQQHVILKLEDLQSQHMQRAQLVLALGDRALAQIDSRAHDSHGDRAADETPLLPLSPQDVARLVGALGLPSGTTAKRAPYTIARAFEFNQRLEEQERFTEGLASAFTRWNRQRSSHSLLAFYAQLMKALGSQQSRAAMTGILFHEAVLTRFLDQLASTTTPLTGLVEKGARALFAYLSGDQLATLCAFYVRIQHHELLAALCFGFISKHLEEDVEAVGSLIPQVELSHARMFITLLQNLQNASAVHALRHISEREEESLKLQVLEWRASHHPELVSPQFERLASSPNVEIRIKSLQIARKHHISSIEPFLSEQINPETFSKRPYSERRLLMTLLLEQSPYTARDQAITLLSARHLNKAHTTSRQLAIEILTQVPTSPAVIQALEEASRRRPWNPKPLQEAAQKALQQHRQERHS